MTAGRIPDLVHGLHDRIRGGVVPDGVVRARQIVVDGPGNAHDPDAVLFCELHGPCKGAVAPDDHQSVDVAVAEHFGPLRTALGLVEILATGTLEDGATPTEDLGHRAGVKAFEIARDQAFVALEDTRHFDAVKDGGADHSADGGIHAGGISTARQHSNALNLAHRIQGRECTAASALWKLVYF